MMCHVLVEMALVASSVRSNEFGSILKQDTSGRFDCGCPVLKLRARDLEFGAPPSQASFHRSFLI
jgi:hypothetical protein